MDMASIFSLLPLLLIIFFIIFFGRNRKGTPVLVLKQFKLNTEDEEFLSIKGRASGILSWLLSLCGIDPVSSVSCNKQSIRFEEAAIRFGKKTLDIPLIAVTGVETGIRKPFELLVLGVVSVILGIVFLFQSYGNLFALCLIIGIVFFISYALKKLMFFSVYHGGDLPAAIIMAKRSIIEGQSVDESKFVAAVNALNKAIIEIHNAEQKNGRNSFS